MKAVWKSRVLLLLALLLYVLTACQPTPATLVSSVAATAEPAAPTTSIPPYRAASLSVEVRVDDLLKQMTLAEKVAQMTQVENNSITPQQVTTLGIGSVLSGGGALRPNNLPETWRNMAESYERAALDARLGIPLLFGVDATHGHSHVYGAVIFPHEIGLGAARDPALVERIGRATAEEMAATSIRWNFAPIVAVPQDIRWGRTYESFSENTELVAQLGAASVRGMQSVDGKTDLSNPLTVLATPKHYLGDGGTVWGTATRTLFGHPFRLDQGDVRADEATVRALYLPPYRAAVDAGAQSIMVSYSSWQGVKMHAHKYLLTDALKGELGFQGFLISDWGAIDQISPDYYGAVVTSINAGVDMKVVPFDGQRFINTLTQAVNKGDVPMTRIDDAVRRILTVKFKMGLFEHPLADPAHYGLIGTAEHRALAREAVQKSLVLLKNEDRALPLAKDTPTIFVAGAGADDLGIMSGGWTIT